MCLHVFSAEMVFFLRGVNTMFTFDYDDEDIFEGLNDGEDRDNYRNAFFDYINSDDNWEKNIFWSVDLNVGRSIGIKS